MIYKQAIHTLCGHKGILISAGKQSIAPAPCTSHTQPHSHTKMMRYIYTHSRSALGYVLPMIIATIEAKEQGSFGDREGVARGDVSDVMRLVRGGVG